jgi:hypothetical protein
MKHYKSTTGDVYAYEEDGSQDHLIPTDFVSISSEEAQSINDAKAQATYQNWLASQPTKEEQISLLQAQLTALGG